MKIFNNSSRWYDKNENMAEIIKLMKDLPNSARAELASAFMHFVTIIRRSNDRESTKLNSIGKDRALGLYKSFKKQRWYDHDESVQKIMKLISTLEEEDFNLIAEGFLKTLKESIE